MAYSTPLTDDDMALVKKIAAWTYKTYWADNLKDILTFHDLYHTGIVGLLEAKQKVDPSGNPAAYLATRVRGAMIDFIRKQGLVRVPKEKWQQAKTVRQAKEALRASGQACDTESLARHLEWPVEVVQKAGMPLLSVVSRDDSGRHKDAWPAGCIIRDNGKTPEEQVLQKDLAAAVQQCLDAIKDHLDRMILISRLQHALKLKTLAQHLKLSIEGVRKKEQRAKEQMKHCLGARGWSNHRINQGD